MRRVPFRTRIGCVTSRATGTSVPPASVKPISKLSLSGTQIDEQKAVALLVLTDELMKFGDAVAGNLFATELSNAVAVETDSSFVSILTAGATSFASNGPTAEQARIDLRGLLNAITTSARSRLFLLMTSTIAESMASMHTATGSAAFPTMGTNGGEIIPGVQAVVSDGVPASTMILADATQIAAASESVQLSATNQASVQMDSAPDSPISSTTPMRSLW